MGIENYYYFFDRLGADPLWRLSWQEFLRLHGRCPWAKGPNLGDGSSSLRGLIAFGVEPEPTDKEIEAILSRHTLQWTIKRSTPQFYVMEEILYNSHRLRKFHATLDELWADDWVVLLAAAVDTYFRSAISERWLKAILKLHYAKFEDFVDLKKKEREELRRLINIDEYAKPIYRWQGAEALLDEEWAGCLGVADTRHLFSLVDWLWSQNSEVSRVRDFEYIEVFRSKERIHHFRDFAISRRLKQLWWRKVGRFKQPCVFRRTE